MDKQRKEEFLRTQEPFRKNAVKIIVKMDEWSNKTENSKHLVDEILHSIFFLGNINKPPYKPQDLFTNDNEILKTLKEKYRGPFEYYGTRLPRRSPFSCVLDMIVLQKKPEDENQIKQCLKDLVDSLDNSFLVSSTICVSESNTSPKYYGVSMSTTGPNAGKIVIAASCLSYWDDYVAGAVMTYYPKKQKKPYFDGTIELPACVTCKAYGIRNGQTMDPCRSCGNLFGLQTNCQKEWPYGNCAEDESLSNLLKKERDVREKVISQPYQQRDRDEAKDDVLKDLKTVLKTIQFKTWDGEFYRAQPQ